MAMLQCHHVGIGMGWATGLGNPIAAQLRVLVLLLVLSCAHSDAATVEWAVQHGW